MISSRELIDLEAKVLSKLNYSLSIPPAVLDEWIEQCNTINDMPFIALNNVFDLHMTYTRLGYNALLPVLLDDVYQMIFDDTMCNLQDDCNYYLYDTNNSCMMMTIPQVIPMWYQYTY